MKLADSVFVACSVQMYVEGLARTIRYNPEHATLSTAHVSWNSETNSLCLDIEDPFHRAHTEARLLHESAFALFGVEVPISRVRNRSSHWGRLCECISCGHVGTCVTPADFNILKIYERHLDSEGGVPLTCRDCVLVIDNAFSKGK